MEQNNSFYIPQNPPQQGWVYPPPPPPAPRPTRAFFPTGKKEILFGVLTLIFGLLLCNCVLFGGFQLGFAVFTAACTLCSVGYLLGSGCKPKPYPIAILILCLLIAAAFARSDDGFVKFVMVCFLAMGINLGLCLLAGQNRWMPGGIGSLLDGVRAACLLGLGRLPESFRGLSGACRRSGTVGKKSAAVALGLGLALLLLCVLIPLLVSADAAFEGLVRVLPQLNLAETVMTLIFGGLLVCYLYSRGVALRHNPKSNPVTKAKIKGLSALTVNIVLAAVSLVYLAYLMSQLAYLSGGFSGILPEGFTMAEYARRGFAEVALVCAINLGIVALAVFLTEKTEKTPLSVRLFCLFISAVTLFLVATASAKMFLYISGYGLTRLRILTEVITLFLGLTTLFVAIWLFVPKLPYMKAVFLTALLMGAVVIWADVDTVVAQYNVTAYQTGTLETVDVQYLANLGDGAVPYLVQLAKDTDPEIAASAREYLQDRGVADSDIRSWNYVNQIAGDCLKDFIK